MSDYPFNQKTMKSLHERIEKLEGKVNCQAKEIDCINARLSLVACAARNILGEYHSEGDPTIVVKLKEESNEQ